MSVFNEMLYTRIAALLLSDKQIDDGTQIKLNTCRECVSFESPEHGASLTVFVSPKTTMRYKPYTLDSFMSALILIFGYQSGVHLKMHELLSDMF